MIEIIDVTQEQIDYAKQLAKDSVENHPVTDIYKYNKPDTYGHSGTERSFLYRYRGTLGEVIFADRYGLPRPKRSFGAIDGQDNGRDFSLIVEQKKYNIDVKTMRRTTENLKPYYVFNLETRQVDKENSLTDYYYGISLIDSEKNENPKRAAIIGFISPKKISEKYEFMPAGTTVKSDDGRVHTHERDCYEVQFGDFSQYIS